jgi:hypothetical protein
MTAETKHDCVERINELLKKHNTRLTSFITMDGRDRIAVTTEKADSAIKKKPVIFFATYCPMCGVKL